MTSGDNRDNGENSGVPAWTEEQVKRRRQRNLAIAWALIGMVALFFIVTIVKLGANIASRPI